MPGRGPETPVGGPAAPEHVALGRACWQSPGPLRSGTLSSLADRLQPVAELPDDQDAPLGPAGSRLFRLSYPAQVPSPVQRFAQVSGRDSCSQL